MPGPITVIKIKAWLKRRGFAGFLVTSLTNIRYLTGFTGTSAKLLITPERLIFLTDFRYELQARQEIGQEWELITQGGVSKLIPALELRGGRPRLGFEPQQLSFAGYQALSGLVKGKARLEPLTNVVENYRLIKTEEEIRLMQTAADIVRSALKRIEPMIRPGIKEIQIKDRLEKYLRQAGADKPAFDIIVASGPNAAKPHAQPGERRIRAGEPVIIDMGADYHGYKSDLTRTFFSGTIRQNAHCYELVANAQDRAIKSISPGRKISDLDRIARKVLNEKGLGEYFGHALGHGIGMEVHEEPGISSRTGSRLKPGMVFTVEPGVYLPGWGGIRIEDMVLVTDKGYRVL